jgi:predicted RNA binding protein YcfA (HicA-like mRNA interferase family)
MPKFPTITTRTATVPDHPGEDLGPGLLRKILNDIEVTREDFI